MQKYTNVRTCLFRKNFEDENAEDVKCASRVLKTIFKSHPSNRLPPIVNLISKTLLFIPRRLYSVYEYFYSVYFYLYALFVPDYHGPYIRRRCVVVIFVQSEFSNRQMFFTKVDKIVSHTQKLLSIPENDKEYIGK